MNKRSDNCFLRFFLFFVLAYLDDSSLSSGPRRVEVEVVACVLVVS